MTKKAAAKPRTTTIRLSRWSPGEIWRVPRGFGAAYRRVLRDHFALIAAGEPGKLISEVVDLLALIGYAATREQVADWDLRRRVGRDLRGDRVRARVGQPGAAPPAAELASGSTVARTARGHEPH